MRAAQIFLLVAWLILVPLFGYLLSTRRHMKRVVRAQSTHRQDELDALSSVMQGGQLQGKVQSEAAEDKGTATATTIKTVQKGDK